MAEQRADLSKRALLCLESVMIGVKIQFRGKKNNSQFFFPSKKFRKLVLFSQWSWSVSAIMVALD